MRPTQSSSDPTCGSMTPTVSLDHRRWAPGEPMLCQKPMALEFNNRLGSSRGHSVGFHFVPRQHQLPDSKQAPGSIICVIIVKHLLPLFSNLNTASKLSGPLCLHSNSLCQWLPCYVCLPFEIVPRFRPSDRCLSSQCLGRGIAPYRANTLVEIPFRTK